jgi:hypothetical protein
MKVKIYILDRVKVIIVGWGLGLERGLEGLVLYRVRILTHWMVMGYKHLMMWMMMLMKVRRIRSVENLSVSHLKTRI